MPNSAQLRSSVSTCTRESSSRMRAATGVPSVGTLWSAVATVRSGRRTERPASRRPSKACGLVTSCTRWRSTYRRSGSPPARWTTWRSQTFSASVLGVRMDSMVQAAFGGTRLAAPVGKQDAERGAAAVACLHPGSAAVHLGEPRDERQADPGPGLVHRVWAAEEGLEDLVAELGRDPRAVVLDRDHGGVALTPAAGPDPRPLRRVQVGVREEVLEDALDLGLIDVGAALAGLQLHRPITEDLRLGQQVSDQLVQIQRVTPRPHDAVIEA